MASISIVVTDNLNGVISNSYNFTDKEIKRVSDALKVVYNGKITEVPTDENVIDDINVNRQLFSLLSRNLIQHILNTVYDTEVQEIMTEARKGVNKLEVREM